VALGKTLATDIRKQMALKNQNIEHRFDGVDPITGFYLKTLFSGKCWVVEVLRRQLKGWP
jgi:hypothetical protein